MAEFLLEIGLEEVPARMLAGAQAELLRRVTTMLCQQNLMSAPDVRAAESFSTPRRLAVYVSGVFARQADSFAKVLGPSAKIAFKEGKPTPAAEAFARKNGLSVADLKVETTPKGDYLVAETASRGRVAAEVLAAELPKEIGAVYWAKTMHWRPGKPERFVRPVLWLVCLLGGEVVPLEFAGKQAGRVSFGHRVLSNGEPFEIVSPSSYAAQLEGEYVLADVEARRGRIRKALDHATREVQDARWREDEPLVDAVTHLIEWPSVLRGSFGEEFLALPQEVLVTVMRDHQKYFAVENASGKLLPHFLTVLNIETNSESERIIRQGNERVLRARFNDARFFWEFDQRVPLAERNSLLEKVIFQKDLGSYAAKTERVWQIARKLIDRCEGAGRSLNFNALKDAVHFAKADLTTELVKEFTELQGVIGGLYARAQSLSETVANAIYDQYLPASASDRLPRSLEGVVLGLADRIDTLAGLFALGLEPTGSKDPFALRRAANAIVRLLAESGTGLLLSDVVSAATRKQALEARLNVFFSERIDFYLREVRGLAYDVVKAVMVVATDDLRDLVARAEAVGAMRGGADFEAVSAAFKRMTNLLEQAVSKGEELRSEVDRTQLIEPQEITLLDRSAEVLPRAMAARERRHYVQALEEIATLREPVDAFFTAVMVMAPEPELRANRLALLSRLVGDFSQIADFSEIVVAGT